MLLLFITIVDEINDNFKHFKLINNVVSLSRD